LAESEGLAAQVLDLLGVTEAVRTRLLEIMSSEGYGRGSNRAYDEHGNFLGYLLVDDEGNPTLVNEAGQPIPVPRSGKHGGDPDPGTAAGLC
jgi:hypothetical protein